MNIEEKIKEYTMEAVDVLGITRLLRGGKWVVMPLEELTTLLQTENYQPKTTSTDIEGLRKEFTQQLTEKVPADNFSNGYIWVCSQNADDVWNFFAPHLSNKSELKKEAVGGFVKLLKEYEFYSGDIGVTANRMGSSMSDLEFLAKQYLSSNENEESEGK